MGITRLTDTFCICNNFFITNYGGLSMSEIKQWKDIQDRYGDSLVLGNGASIAVHDDFSYGSLFETATKLGHIDANVEDVFHRFDTSDFELVLRRLWQATLVNEAMGVHGEAVLQAYQDVRSALINTVQNTHVDYDKARQYFPEICNFMKSFKTVVSLNYDLIVYWALLYGNSEYGGRYFKDGFWSGIFRDDWDTLRKPYGAAKSSTLIFYPHGNLALARDEFDSECKIGTPEGDKLLDTILSHWERGRGVPIFVCEGTADHKKVAIKSSSYLERVNREVMVDLGQTVVIYGWGIGSQDQHLVEQIERNRPLRIAVSIYGQDDELMDRARKEFNGINVEFFDAQSSGAWLFS